MKSDKSTIIKIFIFLMIFLIVLTLFLIFYIIPTMKEYKTNEVILKRYEKRYKKALKENNIYQKKLEHIKAKYKKDIQKYNKTFKESDFISYASKYLNNITIKLDSKKDKYAVYKVEATTYNIKSFYKFVDSLNKYTNIVKITFPIVLKKEEKSYKVSLNVTIISKKLKKHL